MNESFQSFLNRLTRSARSWQAPSPTEQETQHLADEILRRLRQMAPVPGIWWSPLAKRAALFALVATVVGIGLQRTGSSPPAMGSNSIAAAFLSHGLELSNSTSHE